jgi:hypothetical protein
LDLVSLEEKTLGLRLPKRALQRLRKRLSSALEEEREEI